MFEDGNTVLCEKQISLMSQKHLIIYTHFQVVTHHFDLNSYDASPGL